MSSVFLRNLRALYPRARIALLVKEGVRNLVEHCPYANEVLAVRNTSSLLARWLFLPWRMMAFARRNLAGRGISLTIQPRWDIDAHYATVLSYCAGSRWRLGYSEHVHRKKSFYNRGFDSLLTHVVNDRDEKHEIDRGLDLLRSLGATPDARGPELWLDSTDRSIVARLLIEQGLGENARVAAIAPGASRARRQWSPESFAAVGKWLRQEHGCAVAVIGGPQDCLLAEQVVNGISAGAVNLAGRTTLRQTAALLERCVAFVGNDSGPLHLAVAAGVPAVEISCHPRQGSRSDVQSPSRFGPWGHNARVLQPAEPMAPCIDGCEAAVAHCITQITVDEVQQALAELCFNRSSAP
jgi:heptosyltransferase-2